MSQFQTHLESNMRQSSLNDKKPNVPPHKRTLRSFSPAQKASENISTSLSATPTDLGQNGRNSRIVFDGKSQPGHGRSHSTPKWLLADQAHYLGKLVEEVMKIAMPSSRDLEARNSLLVSLGLLCKRVLPEGNLVPFGSYVTGFSTTASDLDLVFRLPQTFSYDIASISTQLKDELTNEMYEVQLLTRTRVPILKLTYKPTGTEDAALHCDIGFKNDLAIHNTQLLQCYSLYDARVRQIVLFIKWWASKRRINSPYRGTLSSYGYVLMILHYLLNVVHPAVLPNLQLLSAEGKDKPEENFVEQDGMKYNVWFYHDVTRLGPSANKASVGELLRGWFEYYCFKFRWGQDVISIRSAGGILSKESKSWTAARTRRIDGRDGVESFDIKDRFLFCLEDPFEITHSVGRTCNFPGVSRIRDELRRAMNLTKARDNGHSIKSLLCAEAPPDPPFVRRHNEPAHGRV